MPTDAVFRFSLYLSLALSCLCIGYAEREIFPEVVLVAAIAIIALAVLFRIETRIELLSLEAANRLGLVLGLVCFAWAGCRIAWEIQHRTMLDTPWLMLLPALVGPLLIASMPAKLARREKHAGDFRFLYGMGLLGAILAGVLTEEVFCFLLAILYVVATIWSLSLLYIRQSAGTILPVPHSPRTTPIAGVVVGSGKQHRVMGTVWLILLSAAVAVPLYLITPRSTAERLSFNQSRIEIGYSADQMTDLNKTGTLKVNDEIAFEVTAEVDGRPKTNLSLEQRWKGTVLRDYDRGIWKSITDVHLPGIEADIHNNSKTWSPPNLGPGQCSLTFTVPGGLPGHFLADPIVWANHQPTPVASLTPTGLHGRSWSPDGSFIFDPPAKNHPEPYYYRQEWREESDHDLSPPFHLQGAASFSLEQTLNAIRKNPVPRVKDYARDVVDQMIRSGVLPSDCRDRYSQLPKREFHDRVAKGLSLFLATTPTLSYTTKLHREMNDIDPIEEFLFYTRAGHCERFATALTLMLRSQGIPAVMVLGFKGCEATKEPGKYLVRQEHAHAWVAALIQEFEPSKDRDRRPMSRWRSLDPTPGTSDDSYETPGSVLNGPSFAWLNKQFRTYLLDYSINQRQRAVEALVNLALQPETYFVLVATLGSVWLLRMWLRSQNQKMETIQLAGNPFYQQFVARLRRCGFIPAMGETPLEFATRVSTMLRKNSKTRAVAEVPLDWVEAFYEARFGDRAISAERKGLLESRVEELTHVVGKNFVS